MVRRNGQSSSLTHRSRVPTVRSATGSPPYPYPSHTHPRRAIMPRIDPGHTGSFATLPRRKLFRNTGAAVMIAAGAGVAAVPFGILGQSADPENDIGAGFTHIV